MNNIVEEIILIAVLIATAIVAGSYAAINAAIDYTATIDETLAIIHMFIKYLSSNIINNNTCINIPVYIDQGASVHITGLFNKSMVVMPTLTVNISLPKGTDLQILRSYAESRMHTYMNNGIIIAYTTMLYDNNIINIYIIYNINQVKYNYKINITISSIHNNIISICRYNNEILINNKYLYNNNN